MLFQLSGHGHFNMQVYSDCFAALRTGKTPVGSNENEVVIL